MDRISILPEDILHNIMSRLNHREAVCTVVLSKSWRQTFSTFPYLVLHENHDAFIRSKQTNFFYDFVDNSLLRFLNQGLTLKKLNLWVDSTNHEKDLQLLYSRIDCWIRLAKDCAVQVLHITLHSNDYNRDYSVIFPDVDYANRYHVPSTLLNARSLVKLILNGYILLDQAFLNHPITFSSLKLLSLRDVHIKDKLIFHNLLTSCPLIEYITLDSCRGFGPVLSIHGLSNLKEVRITIGEIEIMEIEIDAPSLQNFYYCGPDLDWGAETKFKMDKCVNLNELSLAKLNITDGEWFLRHHLFPLMHTLELREVCMPARINISLPQLKVLKLDDCYGLREEAYINIDAPKLYLFRYISSEFNKIDFLNCSSQLEIHVELSFNWVLVCENVREFFQQFEGRSVSATLSFFDVHSFLKIHELQYFPLPPPVIKHLHLHFTDERIVTFPIVTSLLWTCRPSTISCDLSCRTLVKVLCEALMSRKSKEKCFCSSSRDMNCWWDDYEEVNSTLSSSGFFKKILTVFSNNLKQFLFESLIMRSRHVKCWWHDLKEVKVTCSFGIDGKEITVDWKNFLYAFPNLTEGNVSFVLG